ncbi:unnamed protein product [Acanthocheilonema viteae]|uniref:Uncharacterized protein n=1 Tax=Acanthocheilonema viteae TaxID=6277 RepID=A0A498SHG2_ACAVI|nr:unnamed protein product [Acanthocheilonema viteae]
MSHVFHYGDAPSKVGMIEKRLPGSPRDPGSRGVQGPVRDQGFPDPPELDTSLMCPSNYLTNLKSPSVLP